MDAPGDLLEAIPGVVNRSLPLFQTSGCHRGVGALRQMERLNAGRDFGDHPRRLTEERMGMVDVA